MPEHTLAALKKSLREEKMILDAAEEDVDYHKNMAAMRKRDAQHAEHIIADLEESIAALLEAQQKVEG